MSTQRWRNLFFVMCFSIVAFTAPQKTAPSIQAGEVELIFNGGTVAMSEVVFDTPFLNPPIMVCAVSNETTAGDRVGCQGLTAEFGGVSAIVEEPRHDPLVVNWMAMEATQ